MRNGHPRPAPPVAEPAHRRPHRRRAGALPVHRHGQWLAALAGAADLSCGGRHRLARRLPRSAHEHAVRPRQDARPDRGQAARRPVDRHLRLDPRLLRPRSGAGPRHPVSRDLHLRTARVHGQARRLSASDLPRQVEDHGPARRALLRHRRRPVARLRFDLIAAAMDRRRPDGLDRLAVSRFRLALFQRARHHEDPLFRLAA